MDELKVKCMDYDDCLTERDNANSVLKDQLAKSEIKVAEHESELLAARAELEKTKLLLKEREQQHEKKMEETLACREEVINSLSVEREEQNNALSAENAALRDQLKSVETLSAQMCNAVQLRENDTTGGNESV